MFSAWFPAGVLRPPPRSRLSLSLPYVIALVSKINGLAAQRLGSRGYLNAFISSVMKGWRSLILRVRRLGADVTSRGPSAR